VAQAVKSKQKLLLAPEPLTLQGVFQSILDMSKLKGTSIGTRCTFCLRRCLARVRQNRRASRHTRAERKSSYPPAWSSPFRCGWAGPGSGDRKKSTMVKMLASCRGIETRFLVRTLVQNVRTGATLTSVLSALAMAAVLHHNHKGTPHRLCMRMVSFVPVYCPEWSNHAIDISWLLVPVRVYDARLRFQMSTCPCTRSDLWGCMRACAGVAEGSKPSKAALQTQLTAAQEAVKECYNAWCVGRGIHAA
jgi:hypothetical protein